MKERRGRTENFMMIICGNISEVLYPLDARGRKHQPTPMSNHSDIHGNYSEKEPGSLYQRLTVTMSDIVTNKTNGQEPAIIS